MTARPNFGAVLKAFGEIAAEEAEAAAQVKVWPEFRDGRGGGRDRITGPTYMAVSDAADRRVKSIDYMQSPHIISEPKRTPQGTFVAVVGWWALGD